VLGAWFIEMWDPMPIGRPPIPVRVAIVNDSPIVEAGLRAVLQPYRHRVTVVVATARLTDLRDIDVVLFDTVGKADVWAQMRAIQTITRAKLLVFSWASTPDRRAGYVALGASGYLSKNASPEELVAGLESVAAGGILRGAARDSPRDLGDWPGAAAGLTAREAEVIGLIVAGLSNHEVAARLYLSINSVKTHIRSAYRKMGVTRRTQAVVWGLTHGFEDQPHPDPTPRR